MFPHTILVPNQKLCIMTIMHYDVMHYEIVDCTSKSQSVAQTYLPELPSMSEPINYFPMLAVSSRVAGLCYEAAACFEIPHYPISGV